MATSEKSQQLAEQENDTIEIRLSTIIAFLKDSRWYILIGAIAGGLLGAIYAYSLPDQFTSQITVLPELQTKGSASLGNLSSLAGLAGIDVGGMNAGTDAIRPELYPSVLQSVPFALSLLQQPIYSKESAKSELFVDYWQKQQESGIIEWFSGGPENKADISVSSKGADGVLQMTKSRELLIKSLREKLGSTYEKKSGVLTITATIPDPVIAARIVNLSLNYLTDYITVYRTEKSRREVDFLSKQVSLVKHRYQNAEYALSAYRDKNRNLFLNTAKIEEQRLQAEFLLSQDLYNTLSKQAEMAKIKVQEETPVFKVLEPATIPIRKSEPNRGIIVVISIIFGAMINAMYNFIKLQYAKK